MKSVVVHVVVDEYLVGQLLQEIKLELLVIAISSLFRVDPISISIVLVLVAAFPAG
jgi:hypothetical protein